MLLFQSDCWGTGRAGIMPVPLKNSGGWQELYYFNTLDMTCSPIDPRQNGSNMSGVDLRYLWFVRSARADKL